MLPGWVRYLRRRRLQRGATPPTEVSRRSVEVATGAALNSESGPASFAILIGRSIRSTATQTLHQWPLGGRGSSTEYDGIYSSLRESILCRLYRLAPMTCINDA